MKFHIFITSILMFTKLAVIFQTQIYPKQDRQFPTSFLFSMPEQTKAEPLLQASSHSCALYTAVCFPDIRMCFDAPRMQEWLHSSCLYIKFLTVSERQYGSNLRQ